MDIYLFALVIFSFIMICLIISECTRFFHAPFVNDSVVINSTEFSTLHDYIRMNNSKEKGYDSEEMYNSLESGGGLYN